jgi:hypothetical protein
MYATERSLRSSLLMIKGYSLTTADTTVDTNRIALATCAATVLLLVLHLYSRYCGANSYTEA